MKYIKMFENAKDYTVISNAAYAEIVELESVDFSEFELSSIRKVLDSKSTSNTLDVNYGDTDEIENDPCRPYITIDFKSDNCNDLEMVKFDDEWYYVEMYNKRSSDIYKRELLYFKCDQLNGLLQCLKDNV